VLAKKITQPNPNSKPNLTKNTCVTLYLRVGEPTWLTMGSTWVSQVKNQLVLKFVKKFQPNLAQTRGGLGWLADLNPF